MDAFGGNLVDEIMPLNKLPILSDFYDLAKELLSQPIDAQVQEVISERARVSEAFGHFDCIEKVYPSEANFILVKAKDANALYNYLLDNKIIVRNRTNVPGCRNCLRITIGLKEENDRLLDAMKEFM